MLLQISISFPNVSQYGYLINSFIRDGMLVLSVGFVQPDAFYRHCFLN